MKLHQYQHYPEAPALLNDSPIDAQGVIAAIANASQAEFPSALECVAGDLLLMVFLPNSES